MKLRRADQALLWLAGLGGLSAFLLGLLDWREAAGALGLLLIVCQRTWQETLTHAPDLIRALPLLVLMSGGLAGAFEAARTLLATRRFIQPVSHLITPPPPRVRRLASRVGIRGRLHFVPIPLPFAFTRGLLRPGVWISAGLVERLTEEEMEAVLRHEAHHLRACDPLKTVVAQMLGRMLFFLPVTRDFRQAYFLEKETAADQAVVAQMGGPGPFLHALRKLLAAQAEPLPAGLALSGLTVTEARLHALTGSPARPLVSRERLRLSLTLLGGVLLLALLPMAGHVPAASECLAAASVPGWF